MNELRISKQRELGTAFTIADQEQQREETRSLFYGFLGTFGPSEVVHQPLNRSPMRQGLIHDVIGQP